MGSLLFTFQYGQIYYRGRNAHIIYGKCIYIPIWLDLLCVIHSPDSYIMSRFTFQYGQIYYIMINQNLYDANVIYIPIWLDLLYFSNLITTITSANLHSNMVRFIICTDCYLFLLFSYLHSNMVRFIICLKQSVCRLFWSFTFQYGQIYYKGVELKRENATIIYIPIWLDLL